jgi:spore maturation protein CgeB
MIIGSDKVFAIENLYVKHMRECVDHICHFPAQSLFYDYYYSTALVNKILFKIGISTIYRDINKKAKEKIEEFKPDVIWVFKGMEIFPETLKWAKERKIILVNYNPDNPFVFSGAGSGNKNVTDSIELFDFHFTYNIKVKERLEKQYNLKVILLPFGFELDNDLYATTHLQEEILKICFLGNPDKSRALFIKQMAEANLQLDVYGNNWNKFIDHPNVTVFKPVYGNEFWSTLYKYRVQLNLMRQHNPDSHNMRTFEVPGTGGILLAPATKEHFLFFDDNVEAFFYSDLKEAITKAKYLLALPATEANAIRLKARNRSLSSGYSYKDRAKFVCKTLKELANA